MKDFKNYFKDMDVSNDLNNEEINEAKYSPKEYNVKLAERIAKANKETADLVKKLELLSKEFYNCAWNSSGDACVLATRELKKITGSWMFATKADDVIDNEPEMFEL